MNTLNDIVIDAPNTSGVHDNHNNEQNGQNNINKIKRKIKVVFCTLLTVTIIFSGIGFTAYLIGDGQNKMNQSKKLVMPVEAIAMNNSNSYRTCEQRICITTFVTSVRYTFNNQSINEPYESPYQYFINDKLNITISKSTGLPQLYDNTKLYARGWRKRADGIISICVFTIIISPLILGAHAMCLYHDKF